MFYALANVKSFLIFAAVNSSHTTNSCSFTFQQTRILHIEENQTPSQIYSFISSAVSVFFYKSASLLLEAMSVKAFDSVYVLSSGTNRRLESECGLEISAFLHAFRSVSRVFSAQLTWGGGGGVHVNPFHSTL